MRICEKTQIHQFINLNPTTRELGKRNKADTMEATFAAVVQDGGMQSMKPVLEFLGLIPAPEES